MGGWALARLVIVSNRVPAPRTKGAASAGGLAVALQSFVEPGTLWFGWSGRTAAETGTVASITKGDGVTYATIDLGTSDYRQFYVGFANSALWPLLHFRLGLMRYRREDFEGYLSVNAAFAAALMPLLQPRRHDLGARLPPDPAGRRAARAGRQGPHRLLPAHPLRAGLAAGGTAAGARQLLEAMSRLRCGRLPDRRTTCRTSWTAARAHSAASPSRATMCCAASGACAASSIPIGIDAARLRARRGARAPAPPIRDVRASARRPRADHRRRPARLFQGPAAALRGLRAAARALSRAPAPRLHAADRARSREDVAAYQDICGANSTAWPATSTADSPSSTGCRCAT